MFGLGSACQNLERPGAAASCRLVTEGLGIRHLRLVLGPTSWTVLARGMGGEEEPHPIKTPSANDQDDITPAANHCLLLARENRRYSRLQAENIPPYQTDIIVFFTTFSFDPRVFPRISVRGRRFCPNFVDRRQPVVNVRDAGEIERTITAFSRSSNGGLIVMGARWRWSIAS